MANRSMFEREAIRFEETATEPTNHCVRRQWWRKQSFQITDDGRYEDYCQCESCNFDYGPDPWYEPRLSQIIWDCIFHEDGRFRETTVSLDFLSPYYWDSIEENHPEIGIVFHRKPLF